MRTVVDILKDCSSCYNLGEVYKLTEEDCELIKADNITEFKPGTEIDDWWYDELYTWISNIYPEDPYFNQVGAPERGSKVPLEFKMGSMNELKSGDWDKWKVPVIDYVITSKLDGISCGVTFEDGKLKCAQTRGDGYEGADITRHYIKFKETGFITQGKIRGEIIVPKKDIEAFLDGVERETGKRYKNARNAVAGQINSKVATNSFYKYVRFVTYQLQDIDEDEKDVVTFEDSLNKLKQCGFLVANIHGVMSGMNITEDWLINCVKKVKEKDEYECDGIILSMNTLDEDHIGTETNSLNPKDARKFKIGATNLEATTVVSKIEWNPSKDYGLIPVAILRPVSLNGVTVSRATLNNYEWMVSKQVGVGAEVVVKRCGEVIPNIIQVLKPSNNYDLPEHIEEASYKKGVDLCLDEHYRGNLFNSWYIECIAKKILYFCTTLGVEQAGYANVLNIILSADKLPRDYSLEDFISETKGRFEAVIGANGTKLYESLHSILSDVDEAKFFAAIDVFGPLIAERRLEKIIQHFGKLLVNPDDLLNIDGFGDMVVAAYKEGLPKLQHWVTLCTISFKDTVKFKSKEKESNNLANLNVVFTGFRDEILEDLILKNGGKVSSSVSAKTNLVLAKDVNADSSKLKKARQLGVKIFSLKDLNEGKVHEWLVEKGFIKEEE